MKTRTTSLLFSSAASAAALLLAGAGSAQAADLLPVNLTPPIEVTNKYDIFGTLSLKAYDNGTPGVTADDLVYIDFQPPTNNPPVPIPIGQTAESATAALGGSKGEINYAFTDAGKGAFDQFESTGSPPTQGSILDLFLPASFTGGSTAVNIPNAFYMDDPTVTTPIGLGTGANYYNLQRIFDVVLTPQYNIPGNPASGILRTDLSFTTQGTYTGPLSGPLTGSLSFALTFDGQTPAEVFDQIFNPANPGVTNKGFQATGRVVPVEAPEPSAVLGLALVAGVSFLAKKKKQH